MPEQTYDYLIAPKASFDATADAVRALNGTNSAITWGQDGFADAIGDERRYTADEFALGTAPTGDITLTGTSLHNYHFYNCKNITSVLAPNLTTMGTYCFYHCDGMRYARFESLTELPTTSNQGNAFAYMETGRQAVLIFPALTSLGTRNFQRGHIGVVDTGPNLTGAIGTDSFYTNSMASYWPIVNTLILRSSTMITAGSSDAINGLKDVYVPSALISDYEAATNWSTKVAHATYPVTFHAIENSQYDGYWADGTPISTT